AKLSSTTFALVYTVRLVDSESQGMRDSGGTYRSLSELVKGRKNAKRNNYTGFKKRRNLP
ncbi:MAG: hypothetical protein ABR924_23830, partial [Terracidiphilus sp.]